MPARKQPTNLKLSPEVGIRSLKDLTKDELIYCITCSAALRFVASATRRAKFITTSRSSCGIEMKVSSRTRAISSSLYFSQSCEISESEDSSNMLPSPVRSQRSDTLKA